MLGLEPLDPLGCVVPLQVRRGLLGEREEVLGVAPAHGVGLSGCLQPLRRELADRLQHPEAAVLADADEAFVHERLEGVEVGVAHFLHSFERAASREDGQAGEQALLLLV